jgi:hypothetical protein
VTALTARCSGSRGPTRWRIWPSQESEKQTLAPGSAAHEERQGLPVQENASGVFYNPDGSQAVLDYSGVFIRIGLKVALSR